MVQYKGRKKIGEILIQMGRVSEMAIHNVLADQQKTKAEKGYQIRLGDLLLKKRLVTEEDLAEAVSLQYNTEFLDLRTQTIDADLLGKVPANLLKEYNFVPVKLETKRLTIASEDDIPEELFGKLFAAFRVEIRFVSSTRSQISQAKAALLEKVQEVAAGGNRGQSLDLASVLGPPPAPVEEYVPEPTPGPSSLPSEPLTPGGPLAARLQAAAPTGGLSAPSPAFGAGSGGDMAATAGGIHDGRPGLAAGGPVEPDELSTIEPPPVLDDSSPLPELPPPGDPTDFGAELTFEDDALGGFGDFDPGPADPLDLPPMDPPEEVEDFPTQAPARPVAEQAPDPPAILDEPLDFQDPFPADLGPDPAQVAAEEAARIEAERAEAARRAQAAIAAKEAAEAEAAARQEAEALAAKAAADEAEAQRAAAAEAEAQRLAAEEAEAQRAAAEKAEAERAAAEKAELERVAARARAAKAAASAPPSDPDDLISAIEESSPPGPPSSAPPARMASEKRASPLVEGMRLALEGSWTTMTFLPDGNRAQVVGRRGGTQQVLLHLDGPEYGKLVRSLASKLKFQPGAINQPIRKRLSVNVVEGEPPVKATFTVTPSRPPLIQVLLRTEAEARGLCAIGYPPDAPQAGPVLAGGRGLTILASPQAGALRPVYEAVVAEASFSDAVGLALEETPGVRVNGVLRYNAEVHVPTGAPCLAGASLAAFVDGGVRLIAVDREPAFDDLKRLVHLALTESAVLVPTQGSDALNAFMRVKKCGVSTSAMVESTRMVLVAHPTPRVCPYCKETFLVKPEMLPPDQASLVNMKVYRGAGCEACDQKGELGTCYLFETLELPPGRVDVDRLTREKKPLKTFLLEEGLLIPLATHARRALMWGQVSLESYLAACGSA